MKVLKTGLISVALLAISLVSQATAADLGSYGGSLKDEPIHEVAAAPTGGCYLRGGIGYGWNDSDATEVTTGQAYLTSDLDDSVSISGADGCGTSRGLRYELQYTFHGDNEWCGVPAPPDPICADIETHSLMTNLYYDFDMGRRITPYVGAGIGVAYHDMEALDCSPAIPGVCTPGNFQRGGENVTFAWSIMAGVGIDVSDRMTMDVGYRYLDMGDVESNSVDITGFVNTPHRVEDITSHEISVGVRYAIN